ncbi:hypothetical protein Tco_1302015 [Tanacetum coccineum]
MSSSNHPIIVSFDSDIEDAFSSNFPNFILASPDYVPATPGNTYPDSSDDLTKYLLATLVFLPLHDDPYMEIMQAYDATNNELPIPPLQAPISPPTVASLSPMFDSRDFLPPEEISPPKDIETPAESLIPISPSSSVGCSTPVRMPPKRTSTSEAPAMTQAAIKKLVADSVAAALEAQAATMASTTNPNRKGEEQSAEKEKEVSEEELQKLLVIVPVEEVYIESLQRFEDMLKRFDRDDLEKLWDLVKKRFSSTEPTVDKEKELWVKLKRLFKPYDDDTLWKLQRYMHDPLKWRLYDTCGVHHVSTKRGHNIFMLVEKDYPLTRALMTVMLANKLQVNESSEMANGLLKKIFILANNPRQ